MLTFSKSKNVITLIIAVILTFIIFNNSYAAIPGFPRPTQVVILSGDLQSGKAGSVLPEPLKLKLLGNNNIPIGFWAVKFEVTSGDGKLSWNYIDSASQVNAMTNSDGIVSVRLKLGNIKAINKVKVTIEDADYLNPVFFTATVDNSEPVLQPIGNKQINEGAELKFKVSANDSDTDDILTFTANPLPLNAIFDPTTGIFTFKPNWTQAGIYDITFNVSDGFAKDSEKITVTVINVNQPPVLNPIGDRSANEGNELAILVFASDPDGDVLTYSVLGMPSGASFDPTTRIFRWTPGFNVAPQGGNQVFNVIFMVKDPNNASDSEQIKITVNDVQPLVPDIRVLPIIFDNMPSLDFGTTEVGQSSFRIFQIHNDGNAILTLNNIRTTDGQFKLISYLKTNSAPINAINPAILQLLDEATINAYLNINTNWTPVQFSPQNPLMTINYPNLNPNECLLIKAQFIPISSGPKQANFTIESNDPNEAIAIMKARGNATQTPDIRVSLNSINFGNVQLNTSLSIPLNIYNDGNGLLKIQNIVTDDPQFTVSQYSADINPAGQLTINVKFTPTSIGDKTATLRITSNDPDESIVLIELKGKAFRVPTPDISLPSSNIGFGEVEVGSSLAKQFIIINVGDAVLQITGITSSNSQFTVLNNVNNIPAGSQIAISVRFSPTSTGTKVGILTITSNDPDESPTIVSLQGEGIVVPKPNIRVSPNILEFGDVIVGESLIKKFYIYNDGLALLQITSMTSNNSQFVILDNPSNIPVGNLIEVRVRFKPNGLGTIEGKITAASNDPDEPSKQIAVRGNGVRPPSALIRLSPTTLDFGQVQLTQSLTKEFRIYNDGTTTLIVSNISSNNNQFIPLFINTLSIAPNSYATASIRFVPASAGLKTGTIVIASNDPITPTKALTVQGTGFVVPVPDIEVYPMIIDFGEIEFNNSLVKGFYIYNKGNAMLQITSIASSNSQFEVITSFTSISPDYMAPVSVRFTPNSVGTKSAKIKIISNDPDEATVEVAVYGDGVFQGFPATGTWKKITQANLPWDLNDVFFINNNVGWVVGDNGIIANSINGGNTWTNQYSGTSRSLNGIHFTDTYNGWTVGQYGMMLKTNNGGSNWLFPGTTISNTLEAVVFPEPSRGFSAGDSGTIMRYNGSDWSRQNSGTTFDLNDVDFVGIYQGWAVGNYGTILKTIDSGQTWQIQSSNTSYTLYGVDFINSYEGWAVGSNGTILRTQNGGQTWSYQNNYVIADTLTDVDFINSNEGWIVGWNGVILYTANGGQTWVQIESGVNQNLNAVCFTDSQNGWIVGDNGTILKYITDYSPYITSVSVSGSPAHAGGIIKVTAIGQSRNSAKFSIIGVVPNIAMKENPPGTYVGNYTVPDNSEINIKDAMVQVTLTNKFGNIATDTSQKVTIDTTSIIESASVSPKTAKMGDTISVLASGEPGGTARFTIETIISDVFMTEIPYLSGKYIGEYRVQQNINVTNVKVNVKLIDKVGNIAVKEAGTISIDTIAQINSISIAGSPAGLGKQITVTMTGEPNGTAKFSIGNVVTNVAMTESQGAYVGTYIVQQGVYARNALVTVYLTDPYGNTASKDGNYVTVDALCKIESILVTGSPGRAEGRIIVDIVGDPSGSAKFSIAGIVGENTMNEVTAGSGRYLGSYTISSNINVNDAVVTITLIDSFGNSAVDASKKVTIDNIVPIIALVNTNGSPGRVGGKIDVNMTGEPNAKAKFKIGSIADENMREQPLGSGNYSGTYMILGGINVNDAIVTVSLIDLAGNIANDSSQKVTIDNTAPKINSVNVTGSPGRIGGKITISMTGESNAKAKFKIGNTPESNMIEQPAGSGNYLGSYIIPDNINAVNALVMVTLTDLAGNASSDTNQKVTIDNTPPKITTITVTGSPGRVGEKITVTVFSEADAKAKFTIGNIASVEMQDQPTGSGKYVGSYTIADNISVKDATVTITLADLAGNITTDTSQKVTIDSSAPKIESVKATGSPGHAGSKITINMIGEPNAKAKFTIPNIAEENMQEQPAGSGNYIGAYTVIDGVNANDVIITVALIDSAGNVSTDTSQKITIDNTPPKITSAKITGSPGRTGDIITIEIQGESNGYAVFSIAGVISDQPMTENPSGRYIGTYIISSGVNVNNAVVTITLSDIAGNKATDKTQSVTIDTSAPKITSVAVSGSPARINNAITVTLIGEKNGNASFSIANVVQNVNMSESKDNPGTYAGKYIVTEDKNVPNAKLTVTFKDGVGNIIADSSKTVSIVASWDVNGDGLINVDDIMAIGNFFGQKVTADNKADVNGDGVVDILDLAIVCKHFNASSTPSAPSAENIILNDSQLMKIKGLYNQINIWQSNNSDVIIAKELLERIIYQNIPKITDSQLMQNYPNPFNPETWIPYRLSKPGIVNISIYTMSGQLIRKIDLGYREIGDYSAKNKAVYWDGKNDAGEQVSSGIYFYTIKSGDFSATRKMIINR